jgi:hypothetical protein
VHRQGIRQSYCEKRVIPDVARARRFVEHANRYATSGGEDATDHLGNQTVCRFDVVLRQRILDGDRSFLRRGGCASDI